MSFFVWAIQSWDPTDGTVYRTKVEFYSLDQVSNTLFFSLTCVLILFWAELYYISIDKADRFVCLVRPIIYFINLAAYIGVIICSCFDARYFAADVDYVFFQYTILITLIYFIAAVMFTYYAYMAASELANVPITIIARRKRLFSLRVLAVISIFALILKASIIIYLNGKKVETVSLLMLSLVILFYFFTEIFPMIIILIFYRVESNGSKGNDEDSTEENINDSNSTRRPVSTIRSVGMRTQPEVIDAIILRLSLETGHTSYNGIDQDESSDTWIDSTEGQNLIPAEKFKHRKLTS